MYPFAVYFQYREIFDRLPSLEEMVSLIRELDLRDTAGLLCQISADFRLGKRDKEAVGTLQRDLAGYLLDDDTIERLKKRFGLIHSADRPLFHPFQFLNVLRFVVQHSVGSQKPTSDPAARYNLGTACLMMNDLLMTEKEQRELLTGTDETIARSLMTQMLGAFEVINPAAITHVAFRSRIMFHELLTQQRIRERISKKFQGFNFENEFLRTVNMPLSHWLFLLLGFYSYLMHYIDQEGLRSPEFLAIDRTRFPGESRITQEEMNTILKTVGANIDEFRQMLGQLRPTDWRFDFVPFRSKPLIELQPDKFFCSDLGFLVEKMHSGVYWAINDGLSRDERPKLFGAWGILFEEYVNWFLAERKFKEPLFFWPSPKWRDGTESFDGALMQGNRFMPMEYKGGFLKIEARYSANQEAFESDLELKIVEGCRQLAWKVNALFDRDSHSRSTLADIPLNHITRVVPVLVVQDTILRGPLINWWVNIRFNELLDRTKLRPTVVVDSLNVVGIHELETMAESAEAGTFDIFHALQLRCFVDPKMGSELHNFLLGQPGYGQGKSERTERILVEQWADLEEYLFGKQAAEIKIENN